MGRISYKFTTGSYRYMKDISIHEYQFIKCVVDAILHARRVSKRDYLHNSAVERVGQFVVSLRRNLRGNSFDREAIRDLCDTRVWIDAGVPEPGKLGYRNTLQKSYYDMLEEAVMTANSIEAKSMDELNHVIEKEQDLVHKMDANNKEAEKLLSDIKALVANI